VEPKRTEAIILRTKDFGESDRIVTAFSSLYGTLRGIAKGARRSAKRFSNSLNIFSLVNLEFRERRGSDLVWFDSCELIDGYPGIRSDYDLLLKASYMIEMTGILFPPNVVSSEMFLLLESALSCISEKQDTERTMIIFQAQAMRIGGFGINVSKCSLCGRSYKGEGRALFHPPSGSIVCMACDKESVFTPGMDPTTVYALEQVQSHDFSISHTFQCNEDTLKELKRVFLSHVEHRLGKRLKSAKYLNSPGI
jgi:DNA repair protein RecO (recombination protein O)